MYTTYCARPLYPITEFILHVRDVYNRPEYILVHKYFSNKTECGLNLHLLLKQQSYHPEDLLEIAKWYQGVQG